MVDWVPAGECFMVGFNAGAAVPSNRPGLDSGKSCGGGGGGPSGRNPPQRMETSPQTLLTHTHKHSEEDIQKHS